MRSQALSRALCAVCAGTFFGLDYCAFSAFHNYDVCYTESSKTTPSLKTAVIIFDQTHAGQAHNTQNVTCKYGNCGGPVSNTIVRVIKEA